MRWTLAILMLVSFAACGRRDAPTPAPTNDGLLVACTVVLPPNPLLDRLRGDWEMEGELVYRIRATPDGAAVLERITDEDEAAVWCHEIENPRWQDGRLVIDEIAYAIEMPSHPFSGQLTVSYIRPTDDPDVLLNGLLSVEFADELPPDLAEPYKMHRVERGG